MHCTSFSLCLSTVRLYWCIKFCNILEHRQVDYFGEIIALQLLIGIPFLLFSVLERKRGGSVLGDFLFGRNKPSGRGRGKDSRLQILGDGRGMRYINKGPQQPPETHDKMESIKTKNAVYCALVLEEFLKELAAISQEHAVLHADDGYVSISSIS